MFDKVSDSIPYVGVDDMSAGLFEAQYPIPHGMSYNSYIILDREIAIMDSVEMGQGEIWLQQIEHHLDGRTPNYLIIHHMEPDHSACIDMAMNRWPQLRIVASQKAVGMLTQFFPECDYSSRAVAVKDGDTLSLGDHLLTFYSAPMVHWPEVIVSYEHSERILFSADAFGKFGALQYPDAWENEARRYYINIVGKYGPQVQAIMRKLDGVTVDTIAPLHGPVLRGDLTPYLNVYGKWSRYEPECRGVLVAYASIYGGTAAAALKIAEMLRARGAGEVVVTDLCRDDQSEAVAQAFRLSSMIVAAPTYDAGIYPAMHDFLYHLSIKNYRNRHVGIIENGSWAPIAGKLMRGMLEKLPGIEFTNPMVTVRSRLTNINISELEALADAMAAV